MFQKNVKIINKMGIHARPSMSIVEHAQNFQSNIKIIKEELSANAKSIMDIMMLTIMHEETVTIVANGPDEVEAVETIVNVINSGFLDCYTAEEIRSGLT